MGYDIGPKIGIEGEAEFRQAINGLNSTFKTLGTEMAVVTSQFDRNDRSVEALSAQNGVLNKQIDNQKSKLEALKNGLSQAAEKYGENDKVTQGWQRAVNKATADLNNMERQLRQNESAIGEYGDKQIQAARDSEEFKNAQEKLKGTLDVVKVAALAVGASLGAFIKEAMDGADELQRLSDVTGMSAETLQEFQYIGDNLGVGLENITGAQTKLIKSMNSAYNGSKAQSAAFEQLGVSITGIHGGLRDSQETMGDVFEALKNIENPTERDALAMQLLGKSARDLNPLISAGSDELNRLTEEARNSGAVMSNEAISGLDTFGDTMGNVKSALVGKFGEAFAELAPTLTGFTDKLKNIDISPLVNTLKWVIDNSSTIAAGAVAIGTGMATWKVVSTVTGLVEAFNKWRKATEGMTIAQAALNFVMSANPVGLVIVAVASLAAGIAVLWKTNEGFREAVTTAWGSLTEAASGLWEKIKQFFTVDIPGAFNTVINFVKNNWQDLLLLLANPIAGAIKLLYDVNPKFKAWIDGLIFSFKQWIKGFADIGKNIVEGLWGGIANMKSWVFDKIEGFAGDIVDSVKEKLGIHSPSRVFASIGGYMAEGLGNGFASQMESVSRQINDAIPTDQRSISVNAALTSNLSGVNSAASPSNGDTYNFYSPIALTPSETARQFKNMQRSLVLGFR